MADGKSTPLRVAVYARVSTLGKGQDTEVQLRELREYVSCRGWQLADEYVDVGISGSLEKRPELDRLLETPIGADLMPWSFGSSTVLPGAYRTCFVRLKHFRHSVLSS